MSSEKARMLAGEPYDPADPALRADRRRAHALCRELLRADDEARAHRRRAARPQRRRRADAGRHDAGSLVGAGSVVTRDVPAGGYPCHVVRPL